MKYKLSLFFLFGILAFQVAEKNLFKQPSHFPKPEYNFKNNPLSPEKTTLGRVLFYDPILSSDNTISCASCHSPYNSFAHTDHDLSHGINDEIGTRNAPALFNLAWQKKFMWDGAINHLDMQALAPIRHPKEMNESLPRIKKKLEKKSIYRNLFFQAYGDSSITGERILKALSQFQLTLISANSKYDKVKLGKEEFTEQEISGYKIFRQNCNSCHLEPLFSTFEFANNGLLIDTSLNDFGRGNITNNKNDSLKFKIPSLRNLSFSYPYMHDGRFEKLNEVLNHYTNEINQNPTLSKELKRPIILSSKEKVDLIAFLLTLNDKEFVFNPENKYPNQLRVKKD